MGSAASTPPSLDTQRLTMRGHAPGDFDDYTAMWGDPKVVRHVGGRPFTREECWTRFLRQIGHWRVAPFGYWIVREKDSGRFVGEVGFADLKRELVPSIEGVAEMGWVLAAWSHGRGYATEAARAALAWIEAELAPERTVCLIDTDNAASMRVAAKLGYRELARSTYKGQPVIVFER